MSEPTTNRGIASRLGRRGVLLWLALGLGIVAIAASRTTQSNPTLYLPTPTSVALLPSTATPAVKATSLATRAPAPPSMTATALATPSIPAIVAPAIEEPPAATLVPTFAPTPVLENTPTPELESARLVRVIDGDTLDVLVQGQQTHVRLIGVDAPETNQGPLCYGPEVKVKAEEMLEPVGERLLLERDVSETDRYGRLLRYVWYEGANGLVLLNLELVKQGYARVTTFPPDAKYEAILLQAERAAQEQQLGLWGECSRTAEPPAATATPGVQLPATIEPPAATQAAGVASPTAAISLPYDPNGPDRDCGDFSTHVEAQAFFEAAGGPDRDPHRLDADHDGIACETLP